MGKAKSLILSGIAALALNLYGPESEALIHHGVPIEEYLAQANRLIEAKQQGKQINYTKEGDTYTVSFTEEFAEYERLRNFDGGKDNICIKPSSIGDEGKASNPDSIYSMIGYCVIDLPEKEADSLEELVMKGTDFKMVDTTPNKESYLKLDLKERGTSAYWDNLAKDFSVYSKASAYKFLIDGKVVVKKESGQLPHLLNK